MKELIVFAGPNGSGKSTITSQFLDPVFHNAYVNADEIQSSLDLTEYEAAMKAQEAREQLLAQRCNFAFESVMSTPVNIDLLIRAKWQGYNITCYYVLTSDPQINISRVAARVSMGGHDVPPNTIYLRYIRALTLLPILFSICNTVYVFDNSHDVVEQKAHPIVYCENRTVNTYPTDIWSSEMIQSLIAGKYPTDYILNTP